VKTYQPGQNLTLTILLDAVLASAGTFRVIDANDVELLAPAAIADITGDVDRVTVTVPQSVNGLATGNRQEIRQVELVMTTAAGNHVQRELYLLQVADILEIGKNTFCTFARAELVATNLADLAPYQSAAKQDKFAALMGARDALCRLTYRFVRNTQSQLVVDHPALSWAADNLDLYTAAQIAAFPPEFMVALEKAQVLQANFLLGGNPGEHERNDGVLSKTIGESSQMFRAGMAPIEQPVCKRAMRALEGFIRTAPRVTLGRA
jgi:hypothetical protein